MSGVLVALLAGAEAALQNISGGTARFKSDGTSVANLSSPNWHSPTTAGIGSSRWVRITITASDFAVVLSPASSTWHSLASDVLFSATGGIGGCSGLYEIASDSAGANLISRGLFSVSNAA